MTKFDSRESRPKVLADLGVTILPLTNGEYALARCDGYHDVEAMPEITTHETDAIRRIRSLPWQDGFGAESQVLDAANVSGLLARVTGENSLHLTVRGRLRSPRFTFALTSGTRTFNFSVDGVQIEVDGGYEGDRLYVVEAKIGTRNNFIVRQLYYPFRMWRELGIGKEIVPIFLSYSNKVFSFKKYSFEDVGRYDSIRLVESTSFVLEHDREPVDLATVATRTQVQALPTGVPFPQADDLGKVVDLVDVVCQGIGAKEELAEIFEYDPRQSDYYGNAAVFLGLIRRGSGGFAPTDESFQFTRKTRGERLQEIGLRLARLPVFHNALATAMDGAALSRPSIAEEIQHETGVNATTANRRAITVMSWVGWLTQASLL
jgi:hypothetical protein